MKTKPIKHLLTWLVAFAAWLLIAALGLPAFAQGTAFTYQGRLNNNSAPANGAYDMQFALFDAVTAGNPIGSALTTNAVAVSNGLFTVTLDFGAGVFPGADRWLEIGLRTNGGGAFATLNPRQSITATPYAIRAASAASATAAAVVTGSVPASRTSARWRRIFTPPSAQDPTTNTSPPWMPMAWRWPPSRG